MRPSFGNRYLVLVAVGVAAIGTMDAALSREWDLTAVFVLLDLVLLALAVRLPRHRVPVPLRADLATWLRHRAAATGEQLDVVADRAVAAYRYDLGASDDRPPR